MAKTPRPILTYGKPIPLPNNKLLSKLMLNSLYGSANSNYLNKIIERVKLIKKIEDSLKIELLNKNYSFPFGYIYI